ncbi:hypothetical protein A2U01_0104092, partial [Trifolium medium]|nr:hypothetical protein [Trifolium medium]
MDTPNSKLYYK